MNLTFLTQPGKTICFSTILKRLEAKDSPHPHRLSPSLSVVSVLMSWYALKHAKSPICSFYDSKFARGHFRYFKRSWSVIRVRNSKRIMNEKVMSRCLNNDNFPCFSMFGTAILPKVLIYDFGLKDDFFTTWKGRRLKKCWDKKTIFRCAILDQQRLPLRGKIKCREDLGNENPVQCNGRHDHQRKMRENATVFGQDSARNWLFYSCWIWKWLFPLSVAFLGKISRRCSCKSLECWARFALCTTTVVWLL